MYGVIITFRQEMGKDLSVFVGFDKKVQISATVKEN